MEYIKELSHQWTVQIADALAIFVNIANGAHGSRRIELHSLQMIVNNSMQSGSEFCKHILKILAIDALFYLHNHGLQTLHHLQAGLERINNKLIRDNRKSQITLTAEDMVSTSVSGL